MMIIAGTRSGDIYLFRYEPEQEEQRVQSSDDMLQVYSAHDNEIPKEVDFNASQTTIFCITEKGLFSAWNFETLRTEATIPFAKTTINMIVMKKHDRKVLIAFDTQIILLNTDSFAKYEEFTCDFQKKVTDVKLSKKEDKMAVAFAAGNDGNACIEVYKIDHSINKAVRHAIIENISSNVEFMDFSEDDFYLMYKDNVTQKCFFDLTNLKKNDTLAIDFDMEWVSDGIKLSEKTAELDKYCEEDNNFRCMVKAGKRSLIVTDEIGTVVYFDKDPAIRVPSKTRKRLLQAISTAPEFHSLLPFVPKSRVPGDCFCT